MVLGGRLRPFLPDRPERQNPEALLEVPEGGNPWKETPGSVIEDKEVEDPGNTDEGPELIKAFASALLDETNDLRT